MRNSDIFKAVVEGETDKLNWEDEHLRSFTTPDAGNSIVHIAVRYGQLEIVEEASISLPNLVSQKNNYWNTPLHEAAAFGNKETVQLLISHLQESSTSSSTGTGSSSAAPAPLFLLEENGDGDTPFHVALRSRNLMAAEELFSYVKNHPEILVMNNNSREETPLHLFVRYCSGKHFPPIVKRDEDDKVILNEPFICQLIDANFRAVLEIDSEGLNPLMRAAQYGRVFILWIFLRYRQLVDCRDSKRRGFLHHLRLRMSDLNARDKEYTLHLCRKILELPGVGIHTYSQDEDGNTPLHLAILNRDFDFAQLILERYVEEHLGAQESIVSIRNTEAKTVFDLVTSEPGIPHILNDLMELAGRGKIMDEELCHVAKSKWPLECFDSDGDDSDVLCQDMLGKNILHIATEWYHLDYSSSEESEDDDEGLSTYQKKIEKLSRYKKFIHNVIVKYPRLIYQKDGNDDTPMHLAARRLYEPATVLLEECLDYWSNKIEKDDDWLHLEMPPWQVKNSTGDTPLHEAVRNCNHTFLNTMSSKLSPDDLNKALSDVNESGETVFHLIARYTRNNAYRDFKYRFHAPNDNYYLEKFLNANKTAMYMRDVDGFTPMLRAAHCGQLCLVILFYYVVHSSEDKGTPPSVHMTDYKGRNVFHHLCTSGFGGDEAYHTDLHEIGDDATSPVDHMILSKDDDGNTPLHLAILHQHFQVAHTLIERYIFFPEYSDARMQLLMDIKNNDGKSIIDLLSCAVGIPPKLNKLIKSSPVTITKMDDKIYEAAKNGNIKVTEDPNYEFYGEEQQSKWKSQASDGSNVLHIALRHRRISFAQEVIRRRPYYELIHWKDSKGDMPLLLAAGFKSTQEALGFFNCCQTSHKLWNKHGNDNLLEPSKIKNSKGNTFFHEAARLGNYEVVFSELLDVITDNLKDVLNDRDETILHVTARHATQGAMEYLEKYFGRLSPLVFMRDCEGFTPVLRAVQCGRLGVARLLIQKCPESIEIRDNKGRTLLHYMRALVVDLVDDLRDTLPVWKDFFKQEGVDELRSAQDEDGNTPLHLAIIEANFKEAKYLMEICLLSEKKEEVCIQDNDLNSIDDLLSAGSRSNIPAVGELKQLLSRIYTVERQSMYKMDEGLYEAAKQGNVQYITISAHIATDDIESGPTTRDKDYFLRQTADGSNIVHVALKDGNPDRIMPFITKALEDFPYLSLRPDSNRDTPLHLAAKWKDGQELVKSLIDAANNYLNNPDDVGKKAYEVPPWAVKNYRGNFPIHEALQSGNFNSAIELLKCDNEVASLVNDSGETPLHAFANNGFSIKGEELDEFVKELMEKGNLATFAAYTQDREGHIPLMSAARSGRLMVVEAILKYHPQSAYFRDPKGRTFLHVLRFTGEDVDDTSAVETGMNLCENPAVDAQRMVQDNEGNTPLHCAIKNGNTTAAILLTRRCLECQTQNRAELSLMNKDGETVPYLIASHRDVPSEVIELMQKKELKAVRMNRSSYGINKMEMKESANALSVVAALLATITFAAAFQVPGGFSDDGFPILLQKPAFVIFAVANTIAMCSSMLCLFLLLWVMGIGKIHGSLKILDASIFLLRLSYYLTLVTFTTGMFVVTVENSLWLAILICVFSLLTIFLTRRSLILMLSEHVSCNFKRIKTRLNMLRSSFVAISKLNHHAGLSAEETVGT